MAGESPRLREPVPPQRPKAHAGVAFSPLLSRVEAAMGQSSPAAALERFAGELRALARVQSGRRLLLSKELARHPPEPRRSGSVYETRTVEKVSREQAETDCRFECKNVRRPSAIKNYSSAPKAERVRINSPELETAWEYDCSTRSPLASLGACECASPLDSVLSPERSATIPPGPLATLPPSLGAGRCTNRARTRKWCSAMKSEGSPMVAKRKLRPVPPTGTMLCGPSSRSFERSAEEAASLGLFIVPSALQIPPQEGKEDEDFGYPHDGHVAAALDGAKGASKGAVGDKDLADATSSMESGTCLKKNGWDIFGSSTFVALTFPNAVTFRGVSALSTLSTSGESRHTSMALAPRLNNGSLVSTAIADDKQARRQTRRATPSNRMSCASTSRWNSVLEQLRKDQQKEKKELPMREQRRLRMKRRHDQQIQALQELVRHMEKVQPAEVNQNIVEPLAMLRKLVVGQDAPERLGENGKERAVETHVIENLCSSPSSALSSNRSSARLPKRAVQARLASDQIFDPADLSLPPLCGTLVGLDDSLRNSRGAAEGAARHLAGASTEHSHVSGCAGKEICGLAQSCFAKNSDDLDTLSSAELEANSFGSSEDSEGASPGAFSDCCSTGPLTARSSTPATIHALWKKNMNRVRMVVRATGRFSGSEVSEEAVGSGGGDQDAVLWVVTRGDAVRLSSDLNVPVDRVVQAAIVLQRYDEHRTGRIPDDQADAVCREMYSVLYGTQFVPQTLINSCVSSLSRRVNFVDTLKAMAQHAFSQAIVTPPEQVRLRDLARQWEVPLSDVEELKDHFDRFDADKTELLDFTQFQGLLRMILKLPNNIEIPHSRACKFWREIDQAGRVRNGKINFEGFFWWHKRCFAGMDHCSPWRLLHASTFHSLQPRFVNPAL